MASALIAPAALACCGLLAAGPAAADAWRGDARAGSLEFTALQAGATFTGAFGRFEVEFEFDAANPAGSRLEVTVAIASVETHDDDRDEILGSRDFFWTGKFPQAIFHADRLEPDGKGWRASGELSMRGVTRPVAVRFELRPAGERLAMKGTAELRRLEFGIGQGEWAATEWVGDEVGVRFDLELSPAPAARP